MDHKEMDTAEQLTLSLFTSDSFKFAVSCVSFSGASQVAQWLKKKKKIYLPMQVTLKMNWEDPLEEKIATHSTIIAWRIPWTDEPGRLQSMVLQSQT